MKCEVPSRTKYPSAVLTLGLKVRPREHCCYISSKMQVFHIFNISEIGLCLKINDVS